MATFHSRNKSSEVSIPYRKYKKAVAGIDEDWTFYVSIPYRKYKKALSTSDTLYG